MEGIGANKALLDFAIPLAMGVEKSYEDGKLEPKDALNFIPVLPTIMPVVGAFSKLFPEWKDLSEDEQKALHGYAVSKFDLKNDNLEALIENAYNMGLYAMKVVAMFLASKKEEVVGAAV